LMTLWKPAECREEWAEGVSEFMAKLGSIQALRRRLSRRLLVSINMKTVIVT